MNCNDCKWRPHPYRVNIGEDLKKSIDKSPDEEQFALHWVSKCFRDHIVRCFYGKFHKTDVLSITVNTADQLWVRRDLKSSEVCTDYEGPRRMRVNEVKQPRKLRLVK